MALTLRLLLRCLRALGRRGSGRLRAAMPTSACSLRLRALAERTARRGMGWALAMATASILNRAARSQLGKGQRIGTHRHGGISHEDGEQVA